MLLLLLVVTRAWAITPEEKLNPWIGADFGEVVEQLGPPTKSFKHSRGVSHVYDQDFGTVTFGDPELQTHTPQTCRTIFNVDQRGKIVSWKLQGNRCRVQ
jgi:hypothetical protein